MFIFYFLGVELPCRLIFRQFWLCEEVQYVYLCRHLGSLLPHFLKNTLLKKFLISMKSNYQHFILWITLLVSFLN